MEQQAPDSAPRARRGSRLYRTWRWARWIVSPLVVLSALYFMCTGSPIPLWHVEHLEEPVQVREVTREALVLDDGRRVTLPHVAAIPVDSPVFQAALQRGIEVGNGGSLYGLIKIYHWCGHDPVRYDLSRVNLDELAGVLDPDSIVHADEHPTQIERLKMGQSRLQSYSSRGWWGSNQRSLSYVRRLYECIDRDTAAADEEVTSDAAP